MTYIVGADMGQASDYTAKVFLDREAVGSKKTHPVRGQYFEDHYTVRRIERPPLKTPYTTIVTDLERQMRHEELADAELVVDATGVGRPIVDMMRGVGLSPIAVTITGGTQTTQTDDGFWHVPKRILVGALAVAIQTGRLHVVRTLELCEVLQREMMAFKVKLTKAANESYEAWRDGDHDDIVLATALAVWWAERTAVGGWRTTHESVEAARKESRRQAFVEKRDRPYWDRRPTRRT